MGCATATIEIPHASGQRPPLTSRRDAVDPFPYERAPVRVTNHTESQTESYVVRLLRFPSSGENGQEGNTVTARYYESTEPGPRPLVVVLPIWGGHTYPPGIVTSDLVSLRRFNVMRVLGEDSVMDWGALGQAPTPAAFQAQFRRMVERVRATVVDLRRLLDWVETRPAVAAQRVGLIGFSESALQATGAMASDPRIAAAVLLMGGAQPHKIFAACYGPPESVRREAGLRFGWTPEQFAEVLGPLVEPIDPAHLGSRVDAARVLIFEAELDDCMPRSARDALWEALDRPTRVTVRTTHAGAFLGLTFLGGNHMRHRIVEFMKQALP
jgi:dienelactone hydrolase